MILQVVTLGDTALMGGMFAIVLTLAEAVKALAQKRNNKRNGGNPGHNPGCKYDVAAATRTNERLNGIFKCLDRIEKKLG